MKDEIRRSAIFDKDLKVLADSEPADLGILVDHLTDKGEGRLAMSTDTCRLLVSARDTGDFGPVVLGTMARELQAFGGNSVANFFRGGGVGWKEVVCDVADHVGANYNKEQPIEEIELALLAKIAAKTLESMTAEERNKFLDEFPELKVQASGELMAVALIALVKVSGFAAYRVAVIVANAIAKVILGRGLALAGNAALMRSISVLAGPVGWALTGIWTAFDLASPAYRVTLPCVVQVAYLRQKQLQAQREAEQVKCPKCGTHAPAAAKFCVECGTALEA